MKTDHGKEARRYRAEYDWDTGLTHEYSYAMDGKLLTQRSRRAVPTPSRQEIEEAAAIVGADPVVARILRSRSTLTLQGGFALDQEPGEGPCAAPARCLQMLLFEGENVVRYLLVDLRTAAIVEPDYVPPRNREAAR